MSATVAPLLHMNGSSATDLLDGYREVLTRLRGAREALQRHGPNQRDYYAKSDGDTAWRTAQAEHTTRLQALDDIIDDIESMADHVDGQESTRLARKAGR